MVYNCLRVSKGAWVQIPLLSCLFAFFEAKCGLKLDLGVHFCFTLLASQVSHMGMARTSQDVVLFEWICVCMLTTKTYVIVIQWADETSRNKSKNVK